MSQTLPPPDLSSVARAVAALVREDCLLSSNHFGAAFFPEHLKLVTRLALGLAPRLGADPRVLALAGPLHPPDAESGIKLVPGRARARAA